MGLLFTTDIMVVGSLTVECDVVVIGAGPGGYVAAIRAAQLGKDVIIVEKEKKLGGVCLNEGCIPTKALITASEHYYKGQHLSHMGIQAKEVSLNTETLHAWKDGIISKMETGIRGLCEKYGIEVIEGAASFQDNKTLKVFGQSDVNTILFKQAIIATGSKPIEIPGIPFDKKKVISSTEALQLKEIPKKLIIVGGGYIGTELGTVYAKLGSEVHIFEGKDRLIPQMDKDIVAVVAKQLEEKKIVVHYNTLAKSVEAFDGGVVVHYTQDKVENALGADKLMVVVGRIPNTQNLGLEKLGISCNEHGFIDVNAKMQTKVENIYAIGDVVGQPMLAHKASREAKVAAESIAGLSSAFDNKAIPAVVFSYPELMSVGLTKEEAQGKGIEVIEKKFPYAALARAYMFDAAQGFIKMVVEAKTNVVLGVHAAGPHVSELVAEATLAIEMGANAEDIALTIHPHPTISEGISELADHILGQAVHIYSPPKKE